MHADIDECNEDSDGCAQTCTNTIGGYICSCGSGYSLASDAHGCDGWLYLYACIDLDQWDVGLAEPNMLFIFPIILFCNSWSYSLQHANYSPIILINNPHLLVRNENSHEAVPWYSMMYMIIIMTLHGLKLVEESQRFVYNNVLIKGIFRVHFSSSI